MSRKYKSLRLCNLTGTCTFFRSSDKSLYCPSFQIICSVAHFFILFYPINYLVA
uniref:Uncharacterized protein n=1 Tax=Arundo donax TaxID=35708 RepID=A0A0A9H6K1_ARUDO